MQESGICLQVNAVFLSEFRVFLLEFLDFLLEFLNFQLEFLNFQWENGVFLYQKRFSDRKTASLTMKREHERQAV